MNALDYLTQTTKNVSQDDINNEIRRLRQVIAAAKESRKLNNRKTGFAKKRGVDKEIEILRDEAFKIQLAIQTAETMIENLTFIES